MFAWRGRHVSGHVHDGEESWMLEGCGEGCFLWIKQRTIDWLDEIIDPSHERRKTLTENSLLVLDIIIVFSYIFLQ